ncbi:MAG: mechanosensitive ion channel family protein [Elusimicrobiota bacterium]|nr:mechanosensitive ion channel family protein [Elusimicrobiota bacterium]
MISTSLTISNLILLLAFIAAGFIVGIVFEKVIIDKLRKITAKTKFEGDEIVVGAIRGMGIFWFLLLAIYVASISLTLEVKVLAFIQKILSIIFIFSLTWVFAKIAVGFVNLYTKKVPTVLPSTTIFTTLTRIIVFLVGVLIIFQSVGISITPILTALGVGGLAVALALQETLSNLFSGLHIIVSRQIKPGDYIKLDTGEEGYVVDITWRNTTIRALPNNIIVIPNSKLASAIITNYYLPEKEMAVLVQVGVSYDSDLAKVEKVTIEVAKETMREVQGGVAEFEPFIRYHTFADFSINFTVILRAKEFVDQYLIKHEFVKRLHQRYKDEGIEIPFPIRTLYMKGKEKNV